MMLISNIYNSPIFKDICFFIFGVIITWVISRRHSDNVVRKLSKLTGRKEENILLPIREIFEKVEADCQEKAITNRMNAIFEGTEKDQTLLQKGYFLGSLCKLGDSNTALIGFQELSAYPAEIFKENLDYALAKLVTLKNPIGTAFLVTVLMSKLKS